VVRRLAGPKLRRAGGRPVRDTCDRLLLRRSRAGLARARPAPAEPACRADLPRSPSRSRDIHHHADDLEPGRSLHVARRRSSGQILRASARMYVRRAPLFLGLGILFIPLGMVISLVQAAVLGGFGLVGVDVSGESAGASSSSSPLSAFRLLCSASRCSRARRAAPSSASTRADRSAHSRPIG
jgi:hypothetical protein